MTFPEPVETASRDEIAALQLERLRWSISVTNMDTCRAYTPLSDTWGNPKLDEMGRFTCQSGPDVLLHIDGYTVAIGNNLGQALASIRHEDTPRIL